MILGKGTGYGIRAMAFIVRQNGRLCGLQEISTTERIPPVFLRKVLGELRRHRLLHSVKGIHGGYQFSQPPETVSVWDVVHVLDPNPDLDTCILGCDSAAPPCRLHDDWERMRGEIVALLRHTTISDLAGPPAARNSNEAYS